MTATIEREPGCLPYVKAPLKDWQRAGRFMWVDRLPESYMQMACQSQREAEMLAHYLNALPRKPDREIAA